MTESSGAAVEASTLRDYLQVVRRRKWIILQAVLLVPLAAVALALRQDKVYQASAEVLIEHRNLANVLTGTSGSDIYQSVERIQETQAELASTPKVAERVLEASGLKTRSVEGVLASCSAFAKPESNLLVFTCSDYDPAVAVQLATEYANQFREYRRELDTMSIRQALTKVRTRIATLRRDGDTSSDLHRSLVEREGLLETMEALQTANAEVVRPAKYAYQIYPRPFRNGVIGLILGLVLGLGLALLREALDTRVRSAEEIGEQLGLPLLARLPEPPRRLRKANQPVMLAEPNSVAAEPFRMLRTNLDFVRLDRDVKTIMVTSAVEAEGKSTTAANLAIALARAGQRVVLVDLDLRRPFIHRFFGLAARPGLTHVALGHASLDEAIAPVPLVVDTAASGARGRNGNGTARVEGVLEVLLAGPSPPNLGEFVGTRAVRDVLAELRERADVVIIDSAPLLVVGDAMALSGSVDGMILVTRMNVARRPLLRELERVLASAPTQKLGFVVTAAEASDEYRYGNAYYYRSYEREQAVSR